MNSNKNPWVCQPFTHSPITRDHDCLPKTFDEPDLSHPLWVPPYPTAKPAVLAGTDHESDEAALRHAFSVLQHHGVVILGARDTCDRCGWQTTFVDLCFENAPWGLTAIFWDIFDEYIAFGVHASDTVVEGTWTRRWSPNLLHDMIIYRCGDDELIEHCLDQAGLNFSWPFRPHEGIAVHPLRETP